MPTPVGDRVIAISHGEGNDVFIFGYGTYVGRETPPLGAQTILGPMTEELADTGFTNPKIVLDSGDVVWGCQCWWGPEDHVRRRYRLDEKNVVTIPIPEGNMP